MNKLNPVSEEGLNLKSYSKNFEPDPALLTVTGIRFDYAWKLSVAGLRRSTLSQAHLL